jgi:outer membrane protein assembly factor BamE (lipoprotein component of BamABCDE complex)
MRTTSRFAASTILLTLVCLPACLIGSSSNTEYEGTYVSEETLEQVQPGMTSDSVVALLGEPTTKAVTRTREEVWTWRYRRETTSSGSVLLLVSAEKKTESSGAVRVQLRDGRVVKSWREGR